jgi:predicted NAD/FAD-dependent oxidoreductase
LRGGLRPAPRPLCIDDDLVLAQVGDRVERDLPGAAHGQEGEHGVDEEDDAAVAESVRRQAAGWFGGTTAGWRHLRTVRVEHALPDESPAARRLRPAGFALADGLFICGDHCTTASINGALASGRGCAEAVLARRVQS